MKMQMMFSRKDTEEVFMAIERDLTEFMNECQQDFQSNLIEEEYADAEVSRAGKLAFEMALRVVSSRKSLLLARVVQ